MKNISFQIPDDAAPRLMDMLRSLLGCVSVTTTPATPATPPAVAPAPARAPSVVEQIVRLQKDRQKLLADLTAGLGEFSQSTDLFQATRLIMSIQDDAQGHNLSYSQEVPMKVSFAKNPADKYDNARRSRASFTTYVRRFLGLTSSDISDDALDSLNTTVEDGSLDASGADVVAAQATAIIADANRAMMQAAAAQHAAYLAQQQAAQAARDAAAQAAREQAAAAVKLTNDRNWLINRLRYIAEGYAGANLHTNDRALLGIVTDKITNDVQGHYLSLSQEVPAKVSFAKTPDLKFNNDLRTRISLKGYIRKYLLVPETLISDDALRAINDRIFGG